MKVEFQLIVEMPGGYRHIYPKRDLEHAQKGVEDMERDRERSYYFRESDIFIEARQVGDWARINFPDE